MSPGDTFTMKTVWLYGIARHEHNNSTSKDTWRVSPVPGSEAVAGIRWAVNEQTDPSALFLNGIISYENTNALYSEGAHKPALWTVQRMPNGGMVVMAADPVATPVPFMQTQLFNENGDSLSGKDSPWANSHGMRLSPTLYSNQKMGFAHTGTNEIMWLFSDDSFPNTQQKATGKNMFDVHDAVLSYFLTGQQTCNTYYAKYRSSWTDTHPPREAQRASLYPESSLYRGAEPIVVTVRELPMSTFPYESGMTDVSKGQDEDYQYFNPPSWTFTMNLSGNFTVTEFNNTGATLSYTYSFTVVPKDIAVTIPTGTSAVAVQALFPITTMTLTKPDGSEVTYSLPVRYYLAAGYYKTDSDFDSEPPLLVTVFNVGSGEMCTTRSVSRQCRKKGRRRGLTLQTSLSKTPKTEPLLN